MAYSERLSLIAPSISESFAGTLPPIDLIQVDFHDRLNGTTNRDERISAAIDYAATLENGLGINGNGYLGELMNPRRDLPSALFLSSIRLLGEEHFLSGELEGPKSREPEKLDDVLKAAIARKDMQSQIDGYLHAFNGGDPKTKYDALEAIMYESACLLLNVRDLYRDPARLVRSLLSGMLAEHKVFDAIRKGGFDSVRYASPHEDFEDREDLFLDADKNDLPVNLSLQVKGSSQFDQVFRVFERRKTGNLIVEVPMHRSLDQFSLADDHARVLIGEVRGRVRRLQRVRRNWTTLVNGS